MKKFEEIIVSYHSDDIIPYPEYKGKPYFSIKYEENGEHHVGYGTYNPQVLSNYIKDYFMNVEKELESLKAEMHDMLKSDEVKNNYWGNLINNKAHLFLSIIDKHISELKGENKQTDVSVDPYDMKYIRCEKGEDLC